MELQAPHHSEHTSTVQPEQAGQYASIRWKERLGYGIGDFSTNLIWVAITTYLTFFYTDIAHLSAGVIGTVLLVTRLLDGVVDIGIGVLVDRTRSKHGKARPWLKWMSLPFGLSVMLLFTAPDLGATGSIFYAAITYFIVTVIYSSINIPYAALNSLITQEPYQRSMLNITRGVLSMCGGVLISVMALPLVNTLGGGKMGWSLTFVIIGLLSPLLLMITYKTTRERVKPVVVQKQIPLRIALRSLIRNKYWLLVVAFTTLVFLSSGISSALNIYYAQYILHDSGLVGVLALVGLLPIVIGMLVSAPLIKRLGKRNTVLLGMCISLAGALLVLIQPSSLEIVLLSTVLKTLGTAPAVATGAAMLADTVEYGEWKTGARIEGLIYSGSGLSSKIGTGLGGACVGWALAWGGYVGGVQFQSASALQAITTLFLYVPIVLAILQIVLMTMYQLDKRYPVIIAELKAMTNPQS